MPASRARGLELVGIILSIRDYGDHDRIIELLTAERGRLSLHARHARKSRKRFQGSLDLCNRLKVQVSRSRGELFRLDSTLLERGRSSLREDLVKLSLALYACELVGSLAAEEHPEPKLYGLLDTALMVLEVLDTAPSHSFRLALELKALCFGGIMPSLLHCGHCAEPLELGQAQRWSLAKGGLIHAGCGAGDRVPLGWGRGLDQLLRTPLVEVSQQSALEGPAWSLSEHLRWQTGIQLKSLPFLQKLS